MDRDTAKKLGLKYYNTGNPCNHGHISDRYVTNGACKKCVFLQTEKYRSNKKQAKIASYINEVIIEIKVNKLDVDALYAFAEALRQRRRVIYDMELRQSLVRNGLQPPPKAIPVDPGKPFSLGPASDPGKPFSLGPASTASESHLPPVPHEPFLTGSVLPPDPEDDY